MHAFSSLPRNTKPALIALVAGFTLGSVTTSAALSEAAASLGSAWTAALRLTVMPLVVCLLITGLAGTSSRIVGKLGALSLAVFVTLLVVGTILATAITPPLIRAMRVPRATLVFAGMPAPAPGPASSTGAAILQSLSKSELLPVIGITVLFALAMTRIGEERRKYLFTFFDAVLATIVVILSWILTLLPAAVFLLAFAAASHSGLSAARAFASFILLAIIPLVLFTIALYPVAHRCSAACR